jgi:peptide/nickel transport system permease protein
MSWFTYTAKRLFFGVMILFGVSVIVFSIVRLVPGDPARIVAGEFATESSVETIRASLGLNQPVWVQYLDWIGGILSGDFGRSLISGESVNELLKQRYARTMLLTAMALVLSLLISFPAGIISATNRNSGRDYAAMVFSQLGLSMPSFWLGIILILVFAVQLGWFPVSGYHPFTDDPLLSLRHAFLPALTLAVVEAAVLTRFVRSSMLEELNEDYARTARAFGHKPKTVVRKYVLKNALIPAVTVVGLQIGFMLGGTVIIEQVFAWPGVGRLILNSILTRDYPVIQAGLLLLAGTFVLLNLLVDLTYAWLDPRIKY